MKILCATDFSEAAAEATRVAARMASRFGDTLLVVHVFQLPSAGLANLDAAATLEYDRLMREGVADALSDATTAVEDARVTVETRILEGSAAGQIAELAEAEDVRLVVVGSLGRGAVERLVVGSVTDRLARLSARPVLAVRGETAGFDAWGRGDRALRVVMGLDRSTPSMAALELLRTLRAAGPVDVTFVHAYWPPGEAVDVRPAAGSGFVVPDEEVVARLERDLTARIGALPGEGETTLKVWPALGNLGYVLDRFAEDLDADLILVGSHRRGVLGRIWRGARATGPCTTPGARSSASRWTPPRWPGPPRSPGSTGCWSPPTSPGAPTWPCARPTAWSARGARSTCAPSSRAPPTSASARASRTPSGPASPPPPRPWASAPRSMSSRVTAWAGSWWPPPSAWSATRWWSAPGASPGWPAASWARSPST